MPPDALTRSILEQMLQATRTILRRFAPISAPADFVMSDEGLDRLDAICMQLIALGEATKNLDKVTDGSLLPRYPDIEWRRVMGIRGVLSHHQFDLNEEVVFGVCARQIPRLGQEPERMLRDLDSAT